MASKFFVPIGLLLLAHLVPHTGYGARYEIRDLTLHLEGLKVDNLAQETGRAGHSVHSKHSFHFPIFGFLPKATPVPPSGPSKRHNQMAPGGVAPGSAMAGEEVLP
ncbi:hypothetical protein CJ030_MR7G012097 [Morella rubra]|uniref:Uncharacterized protein n=1 Tax=Morella rubra TaxID=262757 RepID=A0A6A1V044_9ROSI|nr:hypothetical protein CJ030_MR7G012097 [Morella rubra]